ncbi:uroporphyrinogen decarboxylase family protein [Treponema primitia]|uniref:uroporphyrinogen decarboxylase family protein n=1 Tax=Treponema primitia TaxID=88058 RepID=UPI0002554F90|nr:uroporphyrinogen decarboxylase family protein [Treponema primitia]
MTKKERIKAALSGGEVDRIPINLWMHFSAEDQDIRQLAKRQVEFTKSYDFDFIKLMPFGLYSVLDYGAKITFFNQTGKPPEVAEGAIHHAKEWGTLTPLDASAGAYGKQVELARLAVRGAGSEFPVIQTIFSPLTTARKLAGDRILQDLVEEPTLFKQALEAITQTTINFVKKNIEAGVDGFFFATQCADSDFLSESLYAEFGEYYDRKVIDSYKDAVWFNVVHIHGNHPYFERLAKYPVPCINWHDRWVSPSLAEARKITGKCLLGGIREAPYYDENHKKIRESLLLTGTEAELQTHLREAVESAGRSGLILGPGCVAPPETTEKNIRIVRQAVESF